MNFDKQFSTNAKKQNPANLMPHCFTSKKNIQTKNKWAMKMTRTNTFDVFRPLNATRVLLICKIYAYGPILLLLLLHLPLNVAWRLFWFEWQCIIIIAGRERTRVGNWHMPRSSNINQSAAHIDTHTLVPPNIQCSIGTRCFALRGPKAPPSQACTAHSPMNIMCERRSLIRPGRWLLMQLESGRPRDPWRRTNRQLFCIIVNANRIRARNGVLTNACSHARVCNANLVILRGRVVVLEGKSLRSVVTPRALIFYNVYRYFLSI